jgi:hypothetical protein
MRGQASVSFPLRFVRVEPLVVGKSAFKGEGGERSDSRVLQVIYDFDAGTTPVYVGQQMDVFIAIEGLTDFQLRKQRDLGRQPRSEAEGHTRP